MEVSEVFLTFIITSVVGLVGVSLRICYKSKCNEVSCCCMKIKRDTQAETEEEEFRITHNVRETPTHSQEVVGRTMSNETMV